jgi:hypothetical protein
LKRLWSILLPGFDQMQRITALAFIDSDDFF